MELEYSGKKKDLPAEETIEKKEEDKAKKEKAEKEDENNDNEGEGGTVKTAAQKKKEKKERERQKKLAQKKAVGVFSPFDAVLILELLLFYHSGNRKEV